MALSRDRSLTTHHKEVHHAVTSPCLSAEGTNPLSRSVGERTRFLSEGDINRTRPATIYTGDGGQRAVVHRDHLPDHLKKIAICGGGDTIFYELNQVCFNL